MKLHINLIYKGTQVDSQQRSIYPNAEPTKTINVDVTTVVEELVKDAINQAIRKLVPAAKLAKRIKKP